MGAPATVNLDGGEMFIASPQYPDLYYDNADCYWSFGTADAANVIEIEVVDWNVSTYAA